MPSDLRVLHVVGGYPTRENPHFQMFIKTQVDSLSTVGIDCEVLVLDGRGPRKYLFGRPQLRRALERGDFDLIHAHYSYCGWVGLGGGLPLVTSFLGSDLYGFPRADGSFPWWMKSFHVNLARYVADRSAACVVKSKAMRDVLGRDAIVVPNGVDCNVFQEPHPAQTAKLRSELGMEPHVIYVLFAGNPELPRKRYNLAKAAVACAVTSTGRDIELLALSGRTHRDVVRYMQACDMLILTSSLEGSPNVVKEAMATNLPVVSVDVGDTRERLDGVSGCRLSDDHSVEAIGRAVAQLVGSEEPCHAREAVMPLHMPHIAERIRCIYNGALGRN